jgi:hypothetical protein
MSSKDTLTKAYGNTPKEVSGSFDFFEGVFPIRPIKHFWLKWIVRKFFR